jgi:dTDP-4-dehydrorhamnose reductase
MTGKKTVLVTGGTGLLGKGLEETMPSGWGIVSLHQRDYKVENSKSRHIVLDIRDKRAVDKLFEKNRFDAVVHAAGIASVDYVEQHYAESLESNIVGTLNVTSACRRAGTHLTYVSTNAVFDGKKPPYRESDPVHSVNKYGDLKLQCEKLVRETLTNWTIVRPILMYGWNHVVTRPNPATWIYEKLLRGEAVSMVNDVWENPLYNISCGHALWAVIAKRPAGTFHLAGKDSVNRYQFAKEVARTFGLDASLIKPVTSKAFPGIAARPRNTTFVTTRMEKELSVKPLTLREGLTAMKAAMSARA